METPAEKRLRIIGQLRALAATSAAATTPLPDGFDLGAIQVATERIRAPPPPPPPPAVDITPIRIATTEDVTSFRNVARESTSQIYRNALSLTPGGDSWETLQGESIDTTIRRKTPRVLQAVGRIILDPTKFRALDNDLLDRARGRIAALWEIPIATIPEVDRPIYYDTLKKNYAILIADAVARKINPPKVSARGGARHRRRSTRRHRRG